MAQGGTEDGSAIKRVFGGLLMAVGGLVAVVSALLTAAFLANLFAEPAGTTDDKLMVSILIVVAIMGGGPIVIGGGLFVIGRGVYRSGKPTPGPDTVA